MPSPQTLPTRVRPGDIWTIGKITLKLESDATYQECAVASGALNYTEYTVGQQAVNTFRL